MRSEGGETSRRYRINLDSLVGGWCAVDMDESLSVGDCVGGIWAAGSIKRPSVQSTGKAKVQPTPAHL
jgi:hypothetical protein